jgi:hypothetical protein
MRASTLSVSPKVFESAVFAGRTGALKGQPDPSEYHSKSKIEITSSQKSEIKITSSQITVCWSIGTSPL